MFCNFQPTKFCENGMSLPIADQCSLSITLEKPDVWCSDLFRGYRKGKLASNGC